MAIQALQPQKQTVQTQEANSDGSKWGALLGALAGGAAVVATGGAALPAVLAAAGSGASLGGLAGGMFNKEAKFGTKDVQNGVQTSRTSEEADSSAIARRAQQSSAAQIAELNKAEKALSLVPPDIAQEYGDTIKQAKEIAMKQQQQQYKPKYGVA
jgi:hypothetical protein